MSEDGGKLSGERHRNWGKKRTDEVKAAMSERVASSWAKPEVRARRIAALKETFSSPSLREKIMLARAIGKQRATARDLVLMADLPLWKAHVDYAVSMLDQGISAAFVLRKLRLKLGGIK